MTIKKATPPRELRNHSKTPTVVKEKPLNNAFEKKQGRTRIIIKYDTGFANELFIRGKGANLSWEKGQKLHNTKNDEWVWETDIPFTTCEFKVLINDTWYETGENHQLASGTNVVYTPQFR